MRPNDAFIVASCAIVTFLIVVLVHQHLAPVAQCHGNPPVVIECLDRSLEEYAPMWQRELARRFTNARGVLVHGGDFVNGQWIVGASLEPNHVTPISEIVNKYKGIDDRQLVLISCNPGHLNLGIPGVFYAKSNVFCVPDREIQPGMIGAHYTEKLKLTPIPTRPPQLESRWSAEPDVIGNVFEFIEE